MKCPQCGAEVPSENEFCGKCGYAMRDEGTGRTDESRIRVHEEPTPTVDDRQNRPSSPRIRKHTVLGMPPASLRDGPAEGPSEPPPPPPPSPIGSARTARRAAQKTMLGIPRPDFPQPAELAEPEPADAQDAEPDKPEGSGRPRAHVRYDSVLESPLAAQRRRRLFLIGGALVALSAGWLIYRFLNG